MSKSYRYNPDEQEDNKQGSQQKTEKPICKDSWEYQAPVSEGWEYQKTSRKQRIEKNTKLYN